MGHVWCEPDAWEDAGLACRAGMPRRALARLCTVAYEPAHLEPNEKKIDLSMMQSEESLPNAQSTPAHHSQSMPQQPAIGLTGAHGHAEDAAHDTKEAHHTHNADDLKGAGTTCQVGVCLDQNEQYNLQRKHGPVSRTSSYMEVCQEKQSNLCI